MLTKVVKNGLNFVLDTETKEKYISISSVKAAYQQSLDNLYKISKEKNYVNTFINDAYKQLDVGFIYFLQNSVTGDIKIGKTKKLEERLKTLQGSNSKKLVLKYLLATVRVSYIERYFHDIFKDYRLEGEWFNKNFLKDINPSDKYMNSIDYGYHIILEEWDKYYSTTIELEEDEQKILTAINTNKALDIVYKKCYEFSKKEKIEHLFKIYS